LEIVGLGLTFNRMINQINCLMQEKDIKEKERMEAEIDALQSQINPHFISNTLNAIHLMAMIAKVESIERMTEAFIKIVNATLSKKGRYFTIEEEVNNLHNYLYIMKVRYGDTFDYHIQIEPEILHKWILRLTLQPILENALQHGISDIDRRGSLQIKGWERPRGIVFEIRDNGAGLTFEQIENLLQQKADSKNGVTGMGIRNVNDRIKLNHGQEYGLSIESEPGVFTLVRIHLPSLTEV